MVFPLPVGAPTNTLSSLLYTALNTGGTETIQLSQENKNHKFKYTEEKLSFDEMMMERVQSGGQFFSFCTLCLNGVEEGELVLVESLKGRVPEGSDGQRLQVQQLSRRGVLLW